MAVHSNGWARAARLGALLVVLSPPGLARADAFRQHYDQAIARYESRDFEGALREFRAAYERRALPRLLINIGRTLFRMGKPREALAFYEQYLRAEPNPLPSVRADVDGYMAQARALVEVPKIPAPDAPALPPAPVPAPALVKPPPDPTAARPLVTPTAPRPDARPTEAAAPASGPVDAGVARAPVAPGASARESGGRTLLALGVPVGVVGLGLLGLGGASLALDGGCADTFCQNLYAGRTAGIAELAVGGVLLSVGVGLSVVGARRRGRVALTASSQGGP